MEKDEAIEKFRELKEELEDEGEADDVLIEGIAEIEAIDPETEEVTDRQVVKNTVVGDDGLQYMADRLLSTPSEADGRFSHIAIGTNDVAPGVTDTFSSEFTHSRDIDASPIDTINTEGETGSSYSTVVQFGPVTFDETGDSGITEAAIVDGTGSTGNSLFNRLTFSSIDNSSQQIQITIYISVGGYSYSP